MSKLLSILTAGALALTLSGFAVGADQEQNSQQAQATPSAADPAASGATPTTPAISEKGSTQQSADPAAAGTTASQSEQEYQAALKKCAALTGTDNTKCVESAKKKSGQL